MAKKKIDIKKFVTGWRLGKFFKKLFGSDKEQQEAVNELASKSTLVVDRIKELSENDTLEALMAEIPGDWEERQVAKVQAALPKILQGMVVGSECAQQQGLIKKAACAVKAIAGNSDKAERTNFYLSLTTKVADALNEKNLNLNTVLMHALGIYVDLKKEGIIK